MVFSSDLDISYLLTTLKTTGILIATLLYLMAFYDRLIIRKVFNIFFLNALICMFFGYFSELKEFFIYPFQHMNDIELIGMSEYRNSFLAGSGYFGIASLYAYAMPIFLYYINKNGNYLQYLKFSLIAIAGILAGRVALLVYMIIFGTYSLYYLKIKFLIFLIIASVLSFYLLANLPQLESVYLWISDIFGPDSYKDSGSLNQLSEMFYFPSDLTFIFGDAKYANVDGSYYGGTDVGYMRNILFGGIAYIILLLGVFLSLFYKLLNNFYCISMFFIALLLHFKGVFILNNPGFFPLTLIAVIYYTDNDCRGQYK